MNMFFETIQEKETVRQLPQTGNEDSFELVALGFVGLGFAMKRKHD